MCLGSDDEGQGWSESQREAQGEVSTDLPLFLACWGPAPRSWLFTASKWAVTHH